MKITLYDKLVNYASGNTLHFQSTRILREQELTRLLGVGQVIQTFLVNDGENLQIQEVMSNGIIVVYSAKDHKKVTMFAPGPNRLAGLFEACGLCIPDDLLIKSELNMQNGYSNILN